MAAMQSPQGKSLLALIGIGNPMVPKSMVLIKGNEFWIESDAALLLAAELGGWWKCFLLLRIFPRQLCNAAYRLIAKNRFRIWGKSEHCFLPRPEWENRFL